MPKYKSEAVSQRQERFLNSKRDHHEVRDFINASKTFMEYHSTIQQITIPDLDVLSCKASTTVECSGERQDLQLKLLNDAIKYSSDVVFTDALGHPFIFYARRSMSSSDIKQLVNTAKLFQDKHEPALKVDPARYTRLNCDPPLPAGHFDLTSVEMGHPEKGIQLSQDYFACRTNAAINSFMAFNKATLPALRAASILYYHLATRGSTDSSVSNIHDRFRKLASAMFRESNDIVQVLLGKSWSPFSQRRLICNLNSLPHFDRTNDQYSLNSLTFFGDARLWLVVIISNRPYAFHVAAGATLLFPASIFLHFTIGWTSGERYVLTNRTSNQLGYKAMLSQ